MAAGQQRDRYANIAAAYAVEAAAGTMVFTELLTGISLGQGVGIIIDQIDYEFDNDSIKAIIAANDILAMGWFSTNTLTAFNPSDNRQIHAISLHGEAVVGTQASANSLIKQPYVSQFFPPIIVASPRLYLGVLGLSMAVVAGGYSRLYYRYVELSSQEYLELAETFVLVG